MLMDTSETTDSLQTPEESSDPSHIPFARFLSEIDGESNVELQGGLTSLLDREYFYSIEQEMCTYMKNPEESIF